MGCVCVCVWGLGLCVCVCVCGDWGCVVCVCVCVWLLVSVCGPSCQNAAASQTGGRSPLSFLPHVWTLGHKHPVFWSHKGWTATQHMAFPSPSSPVYCRVFLDHSSVSRASEATVLELPPLTLSPLKGKEEPWSPNRELRAPTGATGAPMGSYWAKCKALKKWRENKSRPSSFSLFRRAQPHGFLHRNTGLYQPGATSTHL